VRRQTEPTITNAAKRRRHFGRPNDFARRLQRFNRHHLRSDMTSSSSAVPLFAAHGLVGRIDYEELFVSQNALTAEATAQKKMRF